jgi:hypothetical protein
VKRGRFTGMAVGLVACAVAACMAGAAEPLRLGSLEPGEKVYLLGISGEETAFLAASVWPWQEFYKSLKVNDEFGMREALGRMWLTSTGVEVLILELRGKFAEVRILEGQDQGRKGWVPVHDIVRGWGKGE